MQNPPSPTPERPVPPPAAHFLESALGGDSAVRKDYPVLLRSEPIFGKVSETFSRIAARRINLPPKRKKGAGASPLFLIDAPKPVTESRVGTGHPGKPIFLG